MAAQPGSESCLNCGAPLDTEYCAHCGQRNHDTRASLWYLGTEIASEAFEFDSRLRRTLFPFFFKPGLLTKEYNAGRRMRYSSPLRVYLFASFAFFLVFSLTRNGTLQVRFTGSGPSGARAEPASNGGVVGKADFPRLEKLDQLGPAGVRLRQQVEKVQSLDPAAAKKATAQLRAEFVNVLPKLLFILMPLLALVLKVLYLRSGRFYVEHVIFILHVQAFGFLVAIPAVATHSKVLGGLTGIWVLGYELAAMRNVYDESWPKTIVKFFLLQASFSVLELIGVFAAAITGFLSI